VPQASAGPAGARQRDPHSGQGSFGLRDPSSPSAAADLDSGPDSAADPVTDEEDGEDERDLRLPGVAVGELPGLPGQGRGGAEGVWGDGAVSAPGREAAALLAVCRSCGGGGGGGGSVGGGHPARHPALPGRLRCCRTLRCGARPHGSPHHGGWGCRAQPAPQGGESWWERSAEPRGGPWGDISGGHVGFHVLPEVRGKTPIPGVGSPPSSLLWGVRVGGP